MPLSFEGFMRSLSDGGLMEADEIRDFVDSLPAIDRPASAEELAREMVRAGRLTKFQAQIVYQGKAKGLVVGNYVVLDRLGQGGMGQVYVARHRRMQRIVALKMLPAAATKSQDSVQRFQREVRAAARLSHRNIVTAYDADEHNGVHFLVMERVDGRDLQALVKQHGPLPLRDAVDCIIQTAEGLAYAHDQGVVHRDIKPANLLRDKSGTIKILDLGLARIENSLDMLADGALTQTGQVMGTVDYMSPEQSLDTRSAGFPADIYSLGCTLCYLLTGQSPYAGDTLVQKILAHRDNPIPSLRKLRPDAPESLDLVFQKMIAKRPEHRQSSMREVIAAVRACEGVAGDATPVSAGVSTAGDTVGPLRNSAVDTATSSKSGPLDGMSTRDPAQLTRRLIESTRRRLPQALKSRPKFVGGVAAGLLFIALLAGLILKLGTREGTLVVEINETDATVQVFNEKGRLTIERSAGQDTVSIDVDPGKHRLRVEKNGFQVFAQDFAITAGGKEVIKAKLVPVTAPGMAARDSGIAPPLAIAPFDATKAKEHQTAWAKYLGVPVEMTNSIGMKFVLIPPGEFEMGSPSEETDRQINELQHHVRLTRPFCLGKYEVTQAQYQRVMGTNPSDFKALGGNAPVENIPWEDATQFCRQLAELPDEKTARCVYRLPTEAEWEYACRAGTTTPFHFGSQLNGREANCAGNASYGTSTSGPFLGHEATVGSYAPNAFGLYDMHGNLWEWCRDWYGEDYYKTSPTDDPLGPSTATNRVRRGGGWSGIASSCRAASRSGDAPSRRSFYMGFRVVLVPPGN